VQTIANRVLAHCGTPSKLPNTNTSRVNNYPDYTKDYNPLNPPVKDITIFKLLDDAYPDGKAPACSNSRPRAFPLNWKVYYHDAPLSAMCQYVWDHYCLDYEYGGNVWGFEPSFLDPGFEADVKNGLLPKYSFIEPCYTNEEWGIVNSNHPGGATAAHDPNAESLPPPINVLDGERLLCQVYSILRNSPQVFSKTLLIVTYDEHGGLFDHLAPQRAVSPFDPPVDNFNYDRYGVRVPAILINPSITPGTIYPFPRQPHAPIARPFDHTSILSTLIAQFDLNAGLSPRVDAAPQLTDLIPASDVSYSRPVLDCPSRAPVAETGPPRPPLAAVPSGAHTLAGALGPLYQLIQTSKWRRP
jgi:phospholipase C